ncbi:DUF2827 domain-containing protein [Paraburkholderia humisilvae]|uniref:DUF2827 domain-containing protein n=1 Tax=Paraburkholderia humisilvae TaxID=627669 RepID=A0A6J5F685_9BURK|nr:DUF2827 domain-containing protein [Paraburkholderia humisilvae]CAB3773251.1 hypothetical protein LMG29542_07161 [Paraburkholderia humisilvae]
MTYTQLARGPRRVGISIYVRKGPQSLWENGIFQNCLFLAMLFERMPGVELVFLVAGGGDGNLDDARRFLVDSPVPVIDMASAAQQLDLMVEMSAQLDREWIVRFREKGGRVVSMRVGNDYVIDIERMMFNLDPGLLITGSPYDAVWTLPEYAYNCAQYFRSTFRAPVTIVPHLWSPILLDRAAVTLAGPGFGYRCGRRRWRVGIFEPNMCMVKTSFVPMMCCETAHRMHRDRLEAVRVFNTAHLTTRVGWPEFTRALDIVRHGLASFEGRYPFYQVAAAHVDAIVCHQWENAQNYLYYEALYGGYPLIHNSAMVGACGYRYHDFDMTEGGQMLLQAFDIHDQQLDAYRQRARDFLRTLDPEREANIRAYNDAVAALYS